MALRDLNYSNIDERMRVAGATHTLEKHLSETQAPQSFLADFLSSLKAFNELKAQCAPCKKKAMVEGVSASEVKDENHLDKLIELQVRHKALMASLEGVRETIEEFGEDIPRLIEEEKKKYQ